MDVKNKQFIGYLLMNVIAGVGGFGIYYINKLNFDPVLLTLLVEQIGAFLFIAYKWIRYNFQLPEESEPVNIVNLNTNEWQLVTYKDADGVEKSYWERK